MIQEIAVTLMDEDEVYPYDLEGSTRGKELEVLLTNICNLLGDVGTLTEGKADVEFALGVVATYIMAKQRDKLPEGTKPPQVIFDDVLFPQIDKYEEVIVEEIGEDEDGEQLLTRETEAEVS